MTRTTTRRRPAKAAPTMIIIPPQYAAHLEAPITRFRRLARAYFHVAGRLEALQAAIIRGEEVDRDEVHRTLDTTEALERLFLHS
jgi:hypothetical protein